MTKKLKILLIIPALIILGLVWKYWYDYYNISSEEREKIKIDEYNFKQLEKVKSVLDKLDKNSYSVKDLNDFNKQFDIDIKPIKNCYYVTSRNRHFDNKKWGGWYIFWFELESKTYIKKYWTQYFAYPKYDLPKLQICDSWCYDKNQEDFEYIISHPCKDD